MSPEGAKEIVFLKRLSPLPRLYQMQHPIQRLTPLDIIWRPFVAGVAPGKMSFATETN